MSELQDLIALIGERDHEDATDTVRDAFTTLHAICKANQRGMDLLLDFHPYLGYASTQRQVRDILQRRHGCQPNEPVLVGMNVELRRNTNSWRCACPRLHACVGRTTW